MPVVVKDSSQSDVNEIFPLLTNGDHKSPIYCTGQIRKTDLNLFMPDRDVSLGQRFCLTATVNGEIVSAAGIMMSTSLPVWWISWIVGNGCERELINEAITRCLKRGYWSFYLCYPTSLESEHTQMMTFVSASHSSRIEETISSLEKSRFSEHFKALSYKVHPYDVTVRRYSFLDLK